MLFERAPWTGRQVTFPRSCTQKRPEKVKTWWQQRVNFRGQLIPIKFTMQELRVVVIVEEENHSSIYSMICKVR